MTQLPLREIHLPHPISWWPPAIGWWIALILLLLFIFFLTILIKKTFTPTLKKEAINTLNQIEKSFHEKGDALQCLAELSSFLRRASLAKSPSIHAGLTGLAWLKVLDQSLSTPQFSEGVGQKLLHAPYCQHVDMEDARQLIELSRQWVNTL